MANIINIFIFINTNVVSVYQGYLHKCKYSKSSFLSILLSLLLYKTSKVIWGTIKIVEIILFVCLNAISLFLAEYNHISGFFFCHCLDSNSVLKVNKDYKNKKNSKFNKITESCLFDFA